MVHFGITGRVMSHNHGLVVVFIQPIGCVLFGGPTKIASVVLLVSLETANQRGYQLQKRGTSHVPFVFVGGWLLW